MRKCHKSLFYQYLANTVHTLPEKIDDERTNMNFKHVILNKTNKTESKCHSSVTWLNISIFKMSDFTDDKEGNHCKQGSSFTLVPSIKFVNITTCSTFSCQIMNQKSPTVFCLGPVLSFKNNTVIMPFNLYKLNLQLKKM